MELVLLVGGNLLFVLAVMLALWVVCLGLKDVSIVDTFWALGMLFVALFTWWRLGPTAADRQLLLIGLCALWALRLGGHLFTRWRREGPDRRYVALMRRAAEKEGQGFARASLTKVFLTQAPLLTIVSLPVQLGQVAPEPATLGPLALAGAALALVGILFETVGDWQLTRFKADPANHGKVLDTGLWRYTRHPNYFGDTCVWWGLFLIAAETGPGLLSFVGPALLTWILVKWSGAALLERRLKRSRPEYEDYIRRTSAFLPWPPKPAGGTDATAPNA